MADIEFPISFSAMDGSCGVIRFKSTSVLNAKVPVGVNYEKYEYPFTAHGFTSGTNGRLGVPEWHLDYASPNDGAELWEIFNDGTEKLIAIFDETFNKFIPIK